MRLTNEDWKYKIINASPTRLVIVTYEIILDRLETAREALNRGDVDCFRIKLSNAREFVTEMAASVDLRASVSGKLINLYMFTNKLIIKAYFSENERYLREAERIIERLKNGMLKEVDDKDGGLAAAEASGNYSFQLNAPEVCAGYLYKS